MDNGFLSFIKDNWLHVLPNLILGVIGAAIMAERWKALVVTYPLKNMNGFFDQLRDMIMSDRVSEAMSLCDRYRVKPSAHVVKEGLMRANQPETIIEDGLSLAVTEMSQKITRNTSFLGTIANVSVLVGLFGTIIGLIQTFGAMGGDIKPQEKAARLAAGISTAMWSTIIGLGIAISCMVAFSFLMNRTNRLIAELDHSAIRVLDLIKQRFYSAEIDTNSKA